MRCTFCATGKGGFARNLAPHEIMDQALTVQEQFSRRVSNVGARWTLFRRLSDSTDVARDVAREHQDQDWRACLRVVLRLGTASGAVAWPGFRV